MRRRHIPVLAGVLAAATVAGSGSAVAAAPSGNGWQCLSPFATFTNKPYADDPPAANGVLDSLAITVAHEGGETLTATPGRPLALRDLSLTFGVTDTRIAEQMYARTGGSTLTYRGIPYQQAENTARTLAVRPNPADANAGWWSYASDTSTVFVEKVAAPGTPPRYRLATSAPGTVDGYIQPTVGVAHAYLTHTGDNEFPLDAWVALRASNTVEGTQTVRVRGYWTINIADSTPGSATNPAGYADNAVVATVPDIRLALPRTNWTPTGAGPVEFSVAAPGSIGTIQIESKGYDRPGYNTPLNVRPFGSVYVRAQSASYGASNDCIAGQITLADPKIGDSFFGAGDPSLASDPGLGDVRTPGNIIGTNGQPSPVKGMTGRYAFAPVAQPPLVVAQLPAAAPYQAKALTLAARSAKPTRAGALRLTFANPNTRAARFKVTVKSASKVKIGTRKKVITLGTSTTVAAAAGGKKLVKLRLTKTAKSVLNGRKSLKVKVVVTPVGDAAKAMTKTITVK